MEQVCACADAECARKPLLRLDDMAFEVGEELPKVVLRMERAHDCASKLPDGPRRTARPPATPRPTPDPAERSTDADPVVRAEELMKQVCACRDLACTQQPMLELDDLDSDTFATKAHDKVWNRRIRARRCEFDLR